MDRVVHLLTFSDSLHPDFFGPFDILEVADLTQGFWRLMLLISFEESCTEWVGGRISRFDLDLGEVPGDLKETLFINPEVGPRAKRVESWGSQGG